MDNRICDLLGLEIPLFAFSHCRDVVAAVSRAGGMGVLGAVGFSPGRLERELDWIDDHVDGRPYGVDVIMPARSADTGTRNERELTAELTDMIPDGHRRFVEGLLTDYGVPPLPDDLRRPPRALGTEATSYPLIDVALAHPIRLLVNALGPPPAEMVERAHQSGVPVGALVGSVAQATNQVARGVDVVIAQGTEAGGHTGEIATMVLVPEVVDAVAPTPVLAAGGIASGRQMAAAVALGAEGVWTGSMWLTVEESDTTPLVREKLLAATSRDTVRSRAITGKPVRQLRNAWTEAWDAAEAPEPLPWPLQTMLSTPAMARIERARAGDLAGTPVGQVVGRLDATRPTRAVVLEMMEEFVEAVARLHSMLEE